MMAKLAEFRCCVYPDQSQLYTGEDGDLLLKYFIAHIMFVFQVYQSIKTDMSSWQRQIRDSNSLTLCFITSMLNV